MAQLTIITINLNNSIGLEATLKSVVSQTYSDFEFLVLDGVSKDNSVDVIKKYENHISAWRSEKDGGIYNAMNKGIQLSTGDYILFMNSGDTFFSNDVLENISRSLGTADIIYGDVFLSGEQCPKVHPEKLTERFLLTNMICHQAIFASRKLFDTCGYYDETVRLFADYDWLLKAIKKFKCSYKHIPIIVAYYDTTGISSTENSDKLTQEKDKVRKRYFSKALFFVFQLYRGFNKLVSK